MNSNSVYFYLVTALAYITVCYATGLEYFSARTAILPDAIESTTDLPKVGTWTYPAKAEQPCVIVQFAIQLNISYYNMNNTSSFLLYDVPAEQATAINGSCLSDTNSIIIQWSENNQLNNLTIEFGKKSGQFNLSNFIFDLALDNKIFPSIPTLQGPISFEHNKTEFATPMEMSYHCTKPQRFNLTTNASIPDDSDKVNATIVISHVQLEAFNTKKSNQFATAKDCDAIDTPDIVPIAVGCALAGLIIIVLIAYLVGRRRAQARGYLSM